MGQLLGLCYFQSAWTYNKVKITLLSVPNPKLDPKPNPYPNRPTDGTDLPTDPPDPPHAGQTHF